MKRCAPALALGVLVWSAPASAGDSSDARSADSLGDRQILGAPAEGWRVESVTTRVTSFDQSGSGYQSQAGPPLGPGSERAIVLEPQVQLVLSQGERLRHVFTLPVDIVTAASPDATDSGPASVDVVSSASRRNIVGALDWTATYLLDPASTVSMGSGVHIEEPFRSWHAALAGTRAFAGGATVLSATLLDVFDWFDRFDITGHRHGRASRSSATASAGVTQIVTPTTVVNVNYGLTVQAGELGNTWNVVPLTTGDRGPEILPGERVRHALVARASQFLPWNGALRLYYRLYGDDWGLVAHSAEGQLLQRLSPSVYVGALYRFHTQTGVRSFTTLARPDASLRTADSDLAPLDSHTLGGRVVVDLPRTQALPALHLEVGYERYFRTNDLTMNVFTCATGYRF